MPNLELVWGSTWQSIVAVNNYETKLTVIQVLQNSVQFRGTHSEDPNQHIKWFISMCDTFKFNGVSDDAVQLILFLFFLSDEAFMWLDCQPPRSITSWISYQIIFSPALSSKQNYEIKNRYYKHSAILGWDTLWRLGAV